jgi:hypothetical protein
LAKSARALAVVSALSALWSSPVVADADARMGVLNFICGGFFLLPVLHLILTAWVAKDAKARNLDGSALWMLVTLFLGFFGLILYLASRPGGNLVECPACGNRRLQMSARCPHCGNGWVPEAGNPTRGPAPAPVNFGQFPDPPRE